LCSFKEEIGERGERGEKIKRVRRGRKREKKGGEEFSCLYYGAEEC
jgi:hypothetical protein